MSWASRRRSAYLVGVILFFLIVIGGPVLYWYLTIPATCFDGIQNQGETAIDKGGSCVILDERYLQPYVVMWARSFPVRTGIFTAVAYIQNPNPSAGVALAHYHMGLYDSDNALIAERTGTVFIMPGGITPVIETGLDAGNRQVVHTRFEITDAFLVWRRSVNPSASIKINNQSVSGESASPRVDALATNGSLDTLRNVRFVAVLFDAAGNAFAASATSLAQLNPQTSSSIVFTWPLAFPVPVGRIDIIPLLPPIQSSAGAN